MLRTDSTVASELVGHDHIFPVGYNNNVCEVCVAKFKIELRNELPGIKEVYVVSRKPAIPDNTYFPKAPYTFFYSHRIN